MQDLAPPRKLKMLLNTPGMEELESGMLNQRSGLCE